MEQISPLSALVGLFVTALSVIATVVYSHARLTTKVDGINTRLDRMNGRQDRQSEELKTQGQRVAKLEGKIEQEG